MKIRGRELTEVLTTRLGWWEIRQFLLVRAFPVVSRIAWAWRRLVVGRTRIVAVVGTLGKSTTTRMVAGVVGYDIARVSDRNASTALARSVLRVRPGDRHAAIEAGISGPGQMGKYARMIRPDVVVVTSIGGEHHTSLKTLDNTRAEKAKMVEALGDGGVAVLNGDDPNVMWMASRTSARIVTYGFGQGNDVVCLGWRIEWPLGNHVRLRAGSGEHLVQTRLLGRHFVYPVLAAVAVALAEGIGIEGALARIAATEPAFSRLAPQPLPSGAVLICDAYKNFEDTNYAALDTLGAIAAPGRRVLVQGEVSEPTRSVHSITRGIGARAAAAADRAVFIGSRTAYRDFRRGWKDGEGAPDAISHVRAGVHEAARQLNAELGEGDVVLVKGRYDQRLDRVSLLLAGVEGPCAVRHCVTKAAVCHTCPQWRTAPVPGTAVSGPGGD